MPKPLWSSTLVKEDFLALVRLGSARRSAIMVAPCTLFLVALLGCPKPVHPGQDHPPSLTIGYSDTTLHDFQSVSGSGTVKLPLNQLYHHFLLTASAKNDGGVKTLTLTINNPNRTISVSSTPDANNEVSPVLSLMGTNNNGGPGAYGIEIASGSPAPVVTATATNFKDQTNSITVVFASTYPPPTISSLTASPNDGYIYVGQSATLSWSITNCFANCYVSLQGHDGVNYVDLLSSYAHLPLSGSIKITPTRSKMTKYTLVASSSDGSDTKDKVVQLYNGGSASGSVFFFKMTNNQSQVTPCFTIAIYSQDQNTAQQLAEQQNGGYTATPISYQQFVDGC
jgi:hypothetical protein